MKIIIITLSALWALMLTNLVQANPHVTVHYADLDLSTNPGVAALYHRIEVAAQNVCPYEYERALKYQQIRKACVRETIDGAVYYTGNPRLAQYADAHR